MIFWLIAAFLLGGAFWNWVGIKLVRWAGGSEQRAATILRGMNHDALLRWMHATNRELARRRMLEQKLDDAAR